LKVGIFENTTPFKPVFQIQSASVVLPDQFYINQNHKHARQDEYSDRTTKGDDEKYGFDTHTREFA
jgi:hypothetical protein